MDWATVSVELEKPLDPRHVKPAPQGKFGDYVDAHHVISEANRVFGHDGWSYTVTRLQMVSEQIVTLKGRDGSYEQARIGYMATVSVNVDGVIREGAAVGSGMGNPNNLADHHEAAVKEAETDALKRALRSFGNTFGLALYDKDKVNVRVPEFDASADIDRLKTAIAECNTDDALMGLWRDEKALLEKLNDDDFKEVKAAFGEAREQLTKKEAA